MAQAKLPSGRLVKIPNGLTKTEATEYIFEKLKGVKGYEDDHKALGDRLEADGWAAPVLGTAGGIAGGIAGSIIGAAGGGVGAVPGGIIGGAAGAGLGTGVGEWIDQILSGGKGTPSDIAKAAGLGAVTGGAGGGTAGALAKYGLKGGIALGALAGGAEGARQGGVLGGTTGAITGAATAGVGGKLLSSGAQALSKKLGLDKPVQSLLKTGMDWGKGRGNAWFLQLTGRKTAGNLISSASDWNAYRNLLNFGIKNFVKVFRQNNGKNPTAAQVQQASKVLKRDLDDKIAQSQQAFKQSAKGQPIKGTRGRKPNALKKIDAELAKRVQKQSDGTYKDPLTGDIWSAKGELLEEGADLHQVAKGLAYGGKVDGYANGGEVAAIERYKQSRQKPTDAGVLGDYARSQYDDGASKEWLSNPKNVANLITDLTPIVGDAKAAYEAVGAFKKGDYALAGALGGAAIIGLVPGVGDAVASAVKAGARGIEKGATAGLKKLEEVTSPESGTLFSGIPYNPSKSVDVKPEDIIKNRKGNVIDFIIPLMNKYKGDPRNVRNRALLFNMVKEYKSKGYNDTQIAKILDEHHFSNNNPNIPEDYIKTMKHHLVRDTRLPEEIQHYFNPYTKADEFVSKKERYKTLDSNKSQINYVPDYKYKGNNPNVKTIPKENMYLQHGSKEPLVLKTHYFEPKHSGFESWNTTVTLNNIAKHYKEKYPDITPEQLFNFIRHNHTTYDDTARIIAGKSGGIGTNQYKSYVDKWTTAMKKAFSKVRSFEGLNEDLVEPIENFRRAKLSEAATEVDEFAEGGLVEGDQVKNLLNKFVLGPKTQIKGEFTNKQAASLAADLTPIVGDAKAAYEASKAFKAGDYLLAGALGGAAIIGLVPGIGDAAAQAIKAGAKRAGKTIEQNVKIPGLGGSSQQSGGFNFAPPVQDTGLKATPESVKASISFDNLKSDKYNYIEAVEEHLQPTGEKPRYSVSHVADEKKGPQFTQFWAIPKTFKGTPKEWNMLPLEGKTKMRWEIEGKPTYNIGKPISRDEAVVMQRVIMDGIAEVEGLSGTAARVSYPPELTGSDMISFLALPTDKSGIVSPYVTTHEVGHGVDALLNPTKAVSTNKELIGISKKLEREAMLAKGLGNVIETNKDLDLNTVSESKIAKYAKSAYYGKDAVYPPKQIAAEGMADAFSLIMTNPKIAEKFIPTLTSKIKEKINNDKFIKQIIKSTTDNGIPLKTVLGSLGALGVSRAVIDNATGLNTNSET